MSSDVQEVEISESIKDRHLLAEDKSLSGEGDLHLTNVDFTDNGRYVCQMSNELGSFEQPVDLRILGIYVHATSRNSNKISHYYGLWCARIA